jgi:DNA processing protein
MNEVFAIAFSLSKAWSYKTKKEAIDGAGSFGALAEDSRTKFESLDLKSAESQVKKFQKNNSWLWIYGSSDYPKLLSTIPNPPLVIYGMGQRNLNEENLLAMVGTRHPTPYGKRIGLLLAKELIREGLLLVSGLARGIDSLAHQSSIDLKVPTVAVVAHGLDMVYPPENRKLRDEILVSNGTVISEFPFGIKSLPEYFPQRNRIISGLCKGTLVIEASEKSGTRHTIHHALEQSREVFAVPGPIDSDYSIYPNELISSGAIMVRTTQDILSFYPDRKNRNFLEQKGDFKLGRLQRQLLEFLDKNDPKSIEEFLSITTFKPSETLQGLTELELHGVVVKQADSTYVIA